MNLDGDCYQFASISWDGQVCFWDTRFNDSKDTKKQFDVKFINTNKICLKESITGKIYMTFYFQITSHQWKANYGLQLVRPEGGGVMGGA